MVKEDQLPFTRRIALDFVILRRRRRLLVGIPFT
jgi:hypothetical protein